MWAQIVDDLIMKRINSIIILFLISNCALGQRNLTKDEILRNWNLPSNNQGNDSNIIVNSDSVLNVQLAKIVDSLLTDKIDSLIIFSTALPGYTSSFSCDTGIFPITSFIIWNKGKVTHIKKIRGNCVSEMDKDSLAYLFNFYGKYYQKIESDIFMPVIFGGQMNGNKTVTYSMSRIDHEPNYSFYYKIGVHDKSFQFCQSYLDNKKSLFHSHNLNLSAYRWWRQVKQAIDKID